MKRPLLLLLLIAALTLPWWAGGVYYVNLASQVCIAALFALSLNLLVGYAGQVSVAHAAFAGIGGYSVGYLVTAQHWPFAAAILAGTLVAGLVGVLLGLVALGLSE